MRVTGVQPRRLRAACRSSSSLLIAYVAGLFAGFAGSWPLRRWRRSQSPHSPPRMDARPPRRSSPLTAAGAVAATASRRDSASCLHDALARQPLRVVVADSVAPGGYVRAQLDGCDGASVSLAVERGTAAAGSVVDARGVVSTTQRGVLVQHASIGTVRGPPLLARWRAGAGADIDRTFASDAPLVRALLIADRSRARPGHARPIRRRRPRAHSRHRRAAHRHHRRSPSRWRSNSPAWRVLARGSRRSSLSLFYVALIGAPIPAVRCAAMLATFSTSQLAQRPASRWAIVALGAAHPVFDPRAALDVGYQLSVDRRDA